MRTVSVADRRRLLVRRHHLAGDAGGPEQVTRDLVALHATDPASVYLSVLARSRASDLAGIAAAMYGARSLVRWMAMRRTLFVFPRDDVPVVQAAVSTPLAAMLRRRLISRLDRNGTEPAIGADTGAWLAAVEQRVDRALAERGTATGAQLSTDVPALRTTIRPGAPSETPQNLTSTLLTVMSAEGRLVRASATGAWTSRQHRWEPRQQWWPDGLPVVSQAEAEQTLARRWLERFGPATAADLQWWTGWTKGTTARALAGLPVEPVDLHGGAGIDLAGRDDPAGPPAPVAALLPALDPTPMGWTRREWFVGIPMHHIIDRAGNIGPTVWWDGELVGGWAVAPDGEVRTALLADRGAQAAAAVDEAAAALQARLGGAVVVPVFRTSAERALAQRG